MERSAQPQSTQPATTVPATVTTTVTSAPTTISFSSSTLLFDEGFENFFNNESLSDRILNIIETEKVNLLFFKNCFLDYRTIFYSVCCFEIFGYF